MGHSGFVLVLVWVFVFCFVFVFFFLGRILGGKAKTDTEAAVAVTPSTGRDNEDDQGCGSYRMYMILEQGT